MKCFISQALIVFLFSLNVTFGVHFDSPYFLILESEPEGQNVLIKTDFCTSGGYSNVAVTLKKFCVTGFWILISEWCGGNENGQTYFVAGSDSCFEIPASDNIRIKRFMPILQKLSDFDGQAFAWREEASYFIRLNDTGKTVLRPMDGSNKEWNIMAYERNTSRVCYSPEKYDEVFQFYKVLTGGDRPTDAIFEPFQDQRKCHPNFTPTTRDYGRMAGTLYWNSGSDVISRNSTSSFIHSKLTINELVIPWSATRQSSQCADDTRTGSGYRAFEEKVAVHKYPKFPHQLSSNDPDKMIKDEIKETTLRYMQYRLNPEPVPKIKRPEYTLLQKSSAILEKFCCSNRMTQPTMVAFRLLFRFSLLYYQDYFPYQEPRDVAQEERITKALNSCAERTGAKPNECITIQGTNDCHMNINYTIYDEKYYTHEMPGDLKYEEGNLDYVLETAWKSMLFVHYFCASHFENPADHSAYNVKIENFFNPVMRAKWDRPQNAHRIYQLLLNDVNLKRFGDAIDACVDTAHQISKYTRWLSRPDVELLSRRKRDTDGDTCVPRTKPKVFCLERQFDMIDNNLVYPKASSGECYNSYQNRAKYKYIHASKYGTSY